MANLLDKASILITPTAYSDGKIHSAKPIQSLSAEKVVNGDFENGLNGWSQNASAIGSANVVNGLLVYSSPHGDYAETKQINNSVIGKTYLVEFDVVSVGTQSTSISFQYGRDTIFTKNANQIEIKRYSFTAVSTNTDGFNISARTDAEITIDNISVKEVIDSDLNFTRGSSATRVNAQGLVENSQGNNIPRINYKDGVGSWLIEPQSTNLVEYSESFDNSYWVKSGATVTSGFSAPSVDSPLGAFKLVEGSANEAHYTRLIQTTTSGQIYSASIFAKKGERDWIGFYIDSSLTYFNLDSGTIGTTAVGVEAKIEELSNGWYRCIITRTVVDVNQNIRVFISTDGANVIYTGNGTSGVYIFGASLEQQSYPTSYIPTNGTVQTRLSETASRSGLGDLIDSTQGVFYAEMSALADDLTAKYITISDGTNTNRIILSSTTSSNGFRAQIVSGGSSQAEFFTTFADITDFNKVAFKYKLNSFSMFVNGVKIGEDLVGSVFSANSLNSIKYSNADGGVPFYGNIKALAVFPTLTDEELTCLTTI